MCLLPESLPRDVDQPHNFSVAVQTILNLFTELLGIRGDDLEANVVK